jgi:hypothetical protein
MVAAVSNNASGGSPRLRANGDPPEQRALEIIGIAVLGDGQPVARARFLRQGVETIKPDVHVLRFATRQALLARAFGGELAPQDPNDEPVGVARGLFEPTDAIASDG